MRTRLYGSAIGLRLGGMLLLGLVACGDNPTEPAEGGGIPMNIESASTGLVPPVGPLLARGQGGREMVPLRVREWLEAADDAVPIACEGGLQVERNHWTGSALVTHLGRSVADLRIEGCTTELVPAGEELHLWTASFTGSYTAPNGDELWVAGVLRSYVPERIESDLTITGGTGRFAGATGSATGAGSRAADAYLAYSEAHGVISRPNSFR